MEVDPPAQPAAAPPGAGTDAEPPKAEAPAPPPAMDNPQVYKHTPVSAAQTCLSLYHFRLRLALQDTALVIKGDGLFSCVSWSKPGHLPSPAAFQHHRLLT